MLRCVPGLADLINRPVGVIGPSHSPAPVGTPPAGSAVDCPIATSGAAPLIVDGFRRVRRSTFTAGAMMERAEYHRHSRARVAETAKDASRHATPDAPERIDHRRRCTRHDHRTSCRGSRGSASLPCHTLRKRVEMCQEGVRRNSKRKRLSFSRTAGSVHARRQNAQMLRQERCTASQTVGSPLAVLVTRWGR